MKASEVMDHFRQVGTWVNWSHTCDRFLHGDPERDVNGIAVAWICSNAALRKAAEKGLNLFISHEPGFYGRYEGKALVQAMAEKKKALIDECGITVMRCHDTWDRMPKVGIPDAWADFLGFETEERPVESYYKICLMEETTVEEAARRVLQRVKTLGVESVNIFGDPRKRVRRMAVGTGAITNLAVMYELNPDFMLVSEDGLGMATGAHWADDMAMPLIVVSHTTAELPGMMALARYLSERFPEIPVEYLDVGFSYRSIR